MFLKAAHRGEDSRQQSEQRNTDRKSQRAVTNHWKSELRLCGLQVHFPNRRERINTDGGASDKKSCDQQRRQEQHRIRIKHSFANATAYAVLSQRPVIK